ncbi:hypothetical protein MBAV_005623 [Candidatus Magnetobacterium bavaricum]|uniref:Uncharacterized protein n=1 Tax=Candidatus Magnetobacterium bavaricum TaxID=29290 RepID=A0A0F3GNA9_9BACT|nr:hypothetical protein MBAV_005623 [Candidatus Magnetobacterium bavaricum]
MQWQQDVGHPLDAHHYVVGLVDIYMCARGDHLHVHAPDGGRGIEVFHDATESRDNGLTTVGLHHDAHTAFGVYGRVHGHNAGDYLRVTGQGLELTPLLHLQDVVLHVAEVQGVGVVYAPEFFFVCVDGGIDAFFVVFAVVVVQVRVDDYVDVLRDKVVPGQAIFKGVYLTAQGLLCRLGTSRGQLTRVNKYLLAVAL